jgi:signal transduction histidine kinase/streptogramin lyase
MCQDSKGFLWIGTDEGLCVYDGVAYKTYTALDGLGNNYITAVMESRASPGTMWIGTIAGGVVRYDSGRFTLYQLPPDVAKPVISNLAEDHEGTIWCSSAGGVFKLAGGVLQPVGLEPQEYVNGSDLIVAPGGRLWAGLNRRIYTSEPTGGDRKVIDLDIPPAAYIHHIMADREGDIWVTANDSTLRRFSGDRLVTTWRSGSHGIINRVLLDREGDLWMTSATGVLRIAKKDFPRGRMSVYELPKGPREDYTEAILEDWEGDLWFGGRSNGLWKLSDKNVAKIPLVNGGDGFTDDAGKLWLGSSHGVWECWKDSAGEWKTIDHKLIPDDSPVRLVHLASADRKKMWLLLSDSTLRCDSIVPQRRASSTLLPCGVLRSGIDFPGGLIWMMYPEPEKYLWISLGHGVALIDLSSSRPRFVTELSGSDELHMSSVRAIHKDSQGNVWFGDFSQGLAELSGGDLTRKELKHFTTADGLPDNGVRSFAEDEHGRLWIGTRFGGAAVHDSGGFREVSMKEGLLSNAVWSMAKGDGHSMWLGTGAGAIRVNADNLAEIHWSDVMTREACSVYFSEATKTVWIVHPGEVIALWNQDSSRVPPPVYISRVSVNDRPAEALSGLQYSYHENNWVIEFIGLSLRDGQSVRYQYRLKGIDDEWSYLSRGRSVAYAALNSGEYTFEVRAVNGDGLPSSRATSFSFTIVPPFWGRWWFRTVAGILFLGAGPLVYYRRVSRLKKEKLEQQEHARRLIESQENERMRIAAELHDSLGQNLLIIKNHALLGLDSQGNQEELRGQLQEISDIASQTITDVRSITYNLRPYLLDKLGLTKGLQSMLRKVGEAAPLAVESDIETIDGIFTKEGEVHVYRIVQEAVNNLVRHSQATAGSVAIKRDEVSISILVEDNGRGFLQDGGLPAGDLRHGFGLTGLMERVRILGGTAGIKSAPGEGTIVQISIPLSGGAYAR